jgi:hypothetical protein
MVPSVLLSTEGERVAYLASCIANVITGKWIFKHKLKADGFRMSHPNLRANSGTSQMCGMIKCDIYDDSYYRCHIFII